MYNSKYNFITCKILNEILQFILDITHTLQLPLRIIFLCVCGEIVICICFLFVLFCVVFGKKKECILMSIFGHMFSCGVSSDN